MFSRHWTGVLSLERCEPLARVDSSERAVRVRTGVLIGLEQPWQRLMYVCLCLVLLELSLTEHWGYERRFAYDVDVPNNCPTT